jgi:hypothetical protein
MKSNKNSKIMKTLNLAIFSLSCSIGFSSIAHGNTISTQDLNDTLSGTMSYIENTQIRNRRGKGDCRYDFSGGDGCKGKRKNIEGEWVNFINPIVLNSAKNRSEKGIVIADSNMFVTGAILYPLYWVNDKKGNIEKVRKLALKSIRGYKRDKAYSFWPQYTNKRSGDKIIGPVNFRVDDRDISDSIMAKIASNGIGMFIPWVKDWMNTLMDGANNPDGFASFLNVPNDADDTSVAMSLETIQAKKDRRTIDLSPLREITKYRDINRSKHDERDTWTEESTGAYLTWLKDENDSLFGDYETGVMPMGVNNVDCVVNANVVFSLALNNMTKAPGYKDALNYLADISKSGQWLKQCALYYPQVYTFAYSMTRAYRDGGARSEKLDNSMDYLMKDIIKEQKKSGKWCSKPDRTCDYASAMAITSLLNLGEKRAKRLGLLKQYETAINKGINYLIDAKKKVKVTVGKDVKNTYRYKGGLFFAAEDYHLGIWRSKALTNAIVVEAIAKYKLQYHKSEKGLFDFKKKLNL